MYGVSALLALTRANDRLAYSVGKHLCLRSDELNALIHLSERPRLTPSDISRRLQLSPPTITALIDRLEAADLVRRTREGAVDRGERATKPKRTASRVTYQR